MELPGPYLGDVFTVFDFIWFTFGSLGGAFQSLFGLLGNLLGNLGGLLPLG